MDNVPNFCAVAWGFGGVLGRTLTVRLGARAQRDLAIDATDLGLEVSLNYRRSLGSGKFSLAIAQLYGVYRSTCGVFREL